MHSHISTTPVGRRPMTHAILSGLEKAVPAKQGRAIDKWTAFDVIKACHREIGISSRSLTVLHALISFAPEKVLSDTGSLIVWPSNASLCHRCHAISEATLRRAIADLVDAGIVVRRDSPNGKRYVRRGEGGQVQRAFGFDLTPIISRHAEFAEISKTVREQIMKLQEKKEELSILRREIGKMLDFCEAEGCKVASEKLKTLYFARTRDLPRKMTLNSIEVAITSLRPILEGIINTLKSLKNDQKVNVNALQSERHIESSNPESKKIEGQIFFKKEEKREPEPSSETSSLFTPATLIYLDRHCEQIKAVSSITTIRSWKQLSDVSHRASKAIGVRETLWRSLIGKFTLPGAATLIALVYEQLDTISAPFAYLAKLVQDIRPGEEIVRQVMMKIFPEVVGNSGVCRTANPAYQSNPDVTE